LKKKLPAAACDVRQDGASEASGGHVLQRAERGAGHGAGPAGQDYQSRSFIVKSKLHSTFNFDWGSKHDMHAGTRGYLQIFQFSHIN